MKCRSEAVTARRRAVKMALVAERRAEAARCAATPASLAALQFHHIDRATKQFHIAHRGVARSMAAARAEAAKCVLLCANCHAEVEGGVATLPATVAD